MLPPHYQPRASPLDYPSRYRCSIVYFLVFDIFDHVSHYRKSTSTRFSLKLHLNVPSHLYFQLLHLCMLLSAGLMLYLTCNHIHLLNFQPVLSPHQRTGSRRYFYLIPLLYKWPRIVDMKVWLELKRTRVIQEVFVWLLIYLDVDGNMFYDLKSETSTYISFSRII